MIRTGFNSASMNESLRFDLDKYLNSQDNAALRKKVKSQSGAGKFEIYPSMIVWKTKAAYWLRRGSIYTGKEDKITASSFTEAMQKILNLISNDARVSFAYKDENGDLKYEWDPVPPSSKLYVKFDQSKIQGSEIKSFYEYLQAKGMI